MDINNKLYIKKPKLLDQVGLNQDSKGVRSPAERISL